MPVSERIPLLYQEIAQGIAYESIPTEWLRIDLSHFSDSITLFDYQQEALVNAVKLLHYYYGSLRRYKETETELDSIERKRLLFNELRKSEPHLVDSMGIQSGRNRRLFNRLRQYYQVLQSGGQERVQFLNFVNRMSFWMATGSGKTMVLIKLVELLDRLREARLIPYNDILILTHRDDLIEQIEHHVREFNRGATRPVMLWELDRYDEVKSSNSLLFPDAVHVFMYRSDLISDETKEKLLGFEDVENDGRWYVLLDEAHKGDKEDSKRQVFYSIMTRNGFLFNFSATFTDPWDILTTVYNFNLDTFIREGYGKNVYLSQQELTAFGDRTDFSSREKQKIVLKSLLLLTILRMAKHNVSERVGRTHYHSPLLVALVNSVNIEESDLELFFREIERFATGRTDGSLLEEARKELVDEFSGQPRFVFGGGRVAIDTRRLMQAGSREILEYVFNASSFGNIEVIRLPQNTEELVFKLKTSERPFALIKIGDISTWLRDKLTGYEMSDAYETVSVFREISHGNDSVSILMGSRAFYEGWDSNRPNVMVFINIGKGDARKYVTQSIGRGVRIEPIRGRRKRLLPLRREGDADAKDMLSKLDQTDVSLMETLFVLGTSRNNVQDILESIRYEREASGEVIELRENERARERELLIPVYRDVGRVMPPSELPRFEGNRELLTRFFDWIGDDRLIHAIFSHENRLTQQTVRKMREYLRDGNFLPSDDGDLFLQVSRLMRHVNVTMQELDRFQRLADEIVHFKRIRVTLEPEKLSRLQEKIVKVQEYRNLSEKEEELKRMLEQRRIGIDEYTAEIKRLSRESGEDVFVADGSTLKIKYVANHYYLPMILSEREKERYVSHIVTVESERKFLEQVEEAIRRGDGPLGRFDWWMFCKIDEHLDDVYVPYYNRANNRIEKFRPDFIFWLRKGSRYTIVLVDPKGTRHTDYEYKVDGYRLIFEDGSGKREFVWADLTVCVHLFLFTDDENRLPAGYRKYWFDSFEGMMRRLEETHSSLQAATSTALDP
ncbi:MAG: DEAD/DEAH box helicase family protein [Candidatus Thorarchaeota archaeon]